MPSNKNSPYDIDALILPAVEVLNTHGFTTYESCQGVGSHCFSEPTIRLYGNEFDLIRAYEICRTYRMDVYEQKEFLSKKIFI